MTDSPAAGDTPGDAGGGDTGRREPATEPATGEVELALARAERAADRAAQSADVAADEVAAVRDLGTPGAPLSQHSPFYFGFFAGLGALLAWFLFTALTSIGGTVLIVVVSMFLAAGLNPAVEFLGRRGITRGWACTIVITAALGALALFVLALVPVITEQVARLTDNLPALLDSLEQNERVQRLDEEYDVLSKAQDYVTQGDYLSTLFGGVLGFGLAIVNGLFNAFVIVVLTLYFLTSLETTKSALYRMAPASRRDRVARLGDEVVRSIGGYVSGAFFVALTAGISSLVFLFFAGLSEYAVALAFVVALLDFIPMIGATLGAVVVSAIGFATDVKIGLACVVFFVVYQQIENYVIYPRVMGRAVDLPGAVIVIAALVGAGLLGVVGALLAIPTAAAVLLLVREVVVRRQDAR